MVLIGHAYWKMMLSHCRLFLEVLKIAPKLEWDILLLANNSVGLSAKILKKPIKRVRIFGKDLIFSSRQLKKTSSSQKGKDYRIKRLLEEYGFNSRIYPKQLESFRKRHKRI